MGVEETPRACISTGAILSRFGKHLLYFLVCGVVDRHQYGLFSQAPLITLLRLLGLARRTCYISLRT